MTGFPFLGIQMLLHGLADPFFPAVRLFFGPADLHTAGPPGSFDLLPGLLIPDLEQLTGLFLPADLVRVLLVPV